MPFAEDRLRDVRFDSSTSIHTAPLCERALMPAESYEQLSIPAGYSDVTALYAAKNGDEVIGYCVTASKKAMANQKMNLFFMYVSFIGWSLLVLGIFLIYELLVAALLPDSFLGIMFGSLLLSVLAAGVGVYLTPYLNLSICRFYQLATAPQVNEPPHFDSWNGNF